MASLASCTIKCYPLGLEGSTATIGKGPSAWLCWWSTATGSVGSKIWAWSTRFWRRARFTIRASSGIKIQQSRRARHSVWVPSVTPLRSYLLFLLYLQDFCVSLQALFFLIDLCFSFSSFFPFDLLVPFELPADQAIVCNNIFLVVFYPSSSTAWRDFSTSFFGCLNHSSANNRSRPLNFLQSG